MNEDNVVNLFTKQAVAPPEQRKVELPGDDDTAEFLGICTHLANATTVEAYSHWYVEVLAILQSWPAP